MSEIEVRRPAATSVVETGRSISSRLLLGKARPLFNFASKLALNATPPVPEATATPHSLEGHIDVSVDAPWQRPTSEQEPQQEQESEHQLV